MPTSTLLVDDNHTFARIARTFLEQQADLTVVGIATGGREAIELAVQLRPALILIDLGMQDQHGLKTIPHLRASLPNATIVAMSLFVEGGYEDAALEAGANLLIGKDTLHTDLIPALHRSTQRAQRVRSQ